jgi:hypothetical protein
MSLSRFFVPVFLFLSAARKASGGSSEHRAGERSIANPERRVPLIAQVGGRNNTSLDHRRDVACSLLTDLRKRGFLRIAVGHSYCTELGVDVWRK